MHSYHITNGGVTGDPDIVILRASPVGAIMEIVTGAFMRRALVSVILVLGFLAAGVSLACEKGKMKGTKAHHSGDNPVIVVLER